MIEHIWSVICNGSSIDEETHNISLFSVLEQIRVFSDSTGAINLAIHLELFSLWFRGDENVPCRGKMRIYFCDPSDVCQKKAEIEIDLYNAIIFRSRVRVDGLELKDSGRYKFVVELQQEGHPSWNKVACVPFLVDIQAGSSTANG